MASSSGSLQALILAGALAAGASGVAKAADMPALPPPPVVDTTPQFSGWYLRGDVGYGFEQMSGFSSTAASFVPGFSYRVSGIDGTPFIGGGFGYQVNNWFRADITAEYRVPTHYSAFETYSNTTTGGDGYSAHIGSEVVLANGYVDLGTWYGFTPFVGAGVGVAFNQFNNLIDYGTGPDNFGGFGTATNANMTNFAWAAMAGIDYWISPNWRFEVGYRYLDMGRVTSNGIVCQPTCAPPYEVQSFHLASNDVRLGLRYIFAEPPPPAPIVTKY